MILKPSESLKLARGLGIPIPPEADGPPACIKADVPIPHKSDVGAVVCVESREEFERALKMLKERFGDVIIQKMVKGDVELLVSMKKDEVFGKVLVLALGGLWASALKVSSVTACPFCKESFLEILDQRLAKVLKGRKRLDLGCLFNVMEKLCHADAKTFEINPLILSERGCWAVDVKVWL